MDLKTRVTMAKAVVAGLAALNESNQDLILVTCGLSELDVFNFESREQALESVIRHLRPDKLEDVAEALQAFDGESHAGQPSHKVPSQTRPLELFASHAKEDRRLVGDTAKELRKYGVELFVAHDSIEPNASWMREIQQKLNTCHAGVAFVSQDFNKSSFCQQEVGWLLGQQKFISRIMMDAAPTALLAERQATQIAKDAQPADVADVVLTACAKADSLRRDFCESLVGAVVDSTSFKATDKIFEFILHGVELSSDQMERLIEAAEVNSQVFWARCPHKGGQNYRTVIAELVDQSAHRDVFASRTAKLREEAGKRVMIE